MTRNRLYADRHLLIDSNGGGVTGFGLPPIQAGAQSRCERAGIRLVAHLVLAMPARLLRWGLRMLSSLWRRRGRNQAGGVEQ